MNECPMCGKIISKSLCVADCCKDLRKEEKQRAELKSGAADEMYNMLKEIVDDSAGYESRSGKTVTWKIKAEKVLSRARGEL